MACGATMLGPAGAVALALHRRTFQFVASSLAPWLRCLPSHAHPSPCTRAAPAPPGTNLSFPPGRRWRWRR